MQRSSTGYNWKQSKTVLNKYKDYDVSEKQEMDFFFFCQALLWIIDLYFGQKLWFFLVKMP